MDELISGEQRADEACEDFHAQAVRHDILSRVCARFLARQHDQLHMARYIAHKHSVTRYIEMVMAGTITALQGRLLYAQAMENYDELIISAEDYARREANQVDMDQGFRLPGSTQVSPQDREPPPPMRAEHG